jgi:hypothetical protein
MLFGQRIVTRPIGRSAGSNNSLKQKHLLAGLDWHHFHQAICLFSI